MAQPEQSPPTDPLAEFARLHAAAAELDSLIQDGIADAEDAELFAEVLGGYTSQIAVADEEFIAPQVIAANKAAIAFGQLGILAEYTDKPELLERIEERRQRHFEHIAAIGLQLGSLGRNYDPRIVNILEATAPPVVAAEEAAPPKDDIASPTPEQKVDHYSDPYWHLPKSFPSPVECLVILQGHVASHKSGTTIEPIRVQELFNLLLPGVEYNKKVHSGNLKAMVSTYLVGVVHNERSTSAVRYIISPDTPLGIKTDAEAVDVNRFLPTPLAITLADFLYRFRFQLNMKGFSEGFPKAIADIMSSWDSKAVRGYQTTTQTKQDKTRALERAMTFVKGYETFPAVGNLFPADDPRARLLKCLASEINPDKIEHFDILIDLYEKTKDLVVDSAKKPKRAHFVDAPKGKANSGLPNESEFIRDEGSYFESKK